MFAKSFITALVLASYASAVQVTSPTDSTIWSSGTSGQTVSWEAVSSDATSFAVQLVNQAGFLSDSPVTLINNQSTGASNTINSVTVSYPSGSWPTGTAFRINLVTSTDSSSSILAQSDEFNITSGGSSSSGTSASAGAAPTTIVTSTTVAGTSSATVVTVTSGSGSPTTAVGGDASGGIPNAVTTSAATGGAAQLGVPAALAGAMMFFGGIVSLV